MEQEVREINLIIIHCSATRIDRNGRHADTRTLLQKAALQLTVRTLLRKYPRAQVVGHRELPSFLLILIQLKTAAVGKQSPLGY